MPKREQEAEGQLELIDVDGPEFKAVKKELMIYENLQSANREQHSADRKVEHEKRKKVLAVIVAAGIRPDSEGVYHVNCAGKRWDISQEAQLKIHKRALPKDGVAREDDED